jgi:hypothetical protein
MASKTFERLLRTLGQSGTNDLITTEEAFLPEEYSVQESCLELDSCRKRKVAPQETHRNEDYQDQLRD